MATCKECLYFKRCVVLGVELDIKHNKEADKNCRHFENSADYVKVVRCKNCGISELCANTRNCGYLPDDFCSYGVRRDAK